MKFIDIIFCITCINRILKILIFGKRQRAYTARQRVSSNDSATHRPISEFRWRLFNFDMSACICRHDNGYNMKLRIILICSLISLLTLSEGHSQTTTIIDSLNSPIALTFVEDDIYVAIHGKTIHEGQITKFNVNDPVNTYEVLFDSLTFPRAIIAKDSMIYVGLRDEIMSLDLTSQSSQLDTVYHELFLFPRSFEFNGNDLMIAQQKALSKIDLSNENKEIEVLVSFENNPLSIKNYNGSLIIAEGNSIFQYDYDSTILSEIIEGLDHITYSILIVGNDLYIDQSDLSSGEEEIIVYDLNSIASGPVSFCSNLASAIGLTEYNNQIYYASQKPVIDEMYEGKILVINKRLVSTKDQFEIDVRCYPNPLVDVVYFNYRLPLNIDLYDISGHLVKREKSINEIDISELPKGMYQATISDINGRYLTTKTLIKIR